MVLHTCWLLCFWSIPTRKRLHSVSCRQRRTACSSRYTAMQHNSRYVYWDKAFRTSIWCVRLSRGWATVKRTIYMLPTAVSTVVVLH